MNFVYILKCSDNTLYTGWTNDLIKRLNAHNSGKGAKYTHSRIPVELIYFEILETPIEAQKREFYIKKRLTRAQKIDLIEKAENGYKCLNNNVLTAQEPIPLKDFITKNIKANLP
ncbi:MAG: GIY-YIG nuclease family protein [Clostridia bacterium]|nr:GIY-YIG nuclease family protein [Clostridia bacterium]